MALSANQVWEVRTTGSDLNGGGFKAGASGTDYSQQNAAQVTYTDLVIDATTNTKLTSAASPFTSAHVGNLIYINGGTGFTTGRYEVTAVAAGVATMDRAVGTTSSTGGTGKLGGALASPWELVSSGRGMVASNKAFIKSGTYLIATAITTGPTVANPSYSSPPTTIIGYYLSRGDLGVASTNNASRPIFRAGAALNVIFYPNTSGWNLKNIACDDGTFTFNYFTFGCTNSVFVNCKVSNFGNTGMYVSGNCLIQSCEITGGKSGSTAGIAGNSFNHYCDNNIHDNQCTGILATNGSMILNNLITNNTGATSDGLSLNTFTRAYQNTVYGSGRHGVNITNSSFGCQAVLGNVLANNGGYGLTCTQGSGLPASELWDGNAYFSNILGTRNNLDDTTSNLVNGVAPYANSLDVTLTTTPFNNSGSNDFSLNNTSGGGAACRGLGGSNAWPGSSVAGYRDFGAVQHQDSGVTTITTFIEG